MKLDEAYQIQDVIERERLLLVHLYFLLPDQIHPAKFNNHSKHTAR